MTAIYSNVRGGKAGQIDVGRGPSRVDLAAWPCRAGGATGHDLNSMRGRAAAARQSHNLEAVGASPTPATNSPAKGFVGRSDPAAMQGSRMAVRVPPPPVHRHPSFSFTRCGQLGGDSARDGSKSLHANQRGGDFVQMLGKTRPENRTGNDARG